MYKLYSIAGSCSTAITVLLNKLGVEFEVVQRDDIKNYRDMVATNQVPALDDNGQIITEGAAIVLYLLEKHNSSMLPSNISEKGKFLQYIMFNYATLHPSYSRIFAVAKTLDHGDSNKQELMQKMADSVSYNWNILNNRLVSRRYIVGDQVTVIDYLVAVYASWGKYFPELKITFGENVLRLVNEVSALPEFKAAYQLEKVEYKILDSTATA
ncbi:glutathione S-transferase family protein [Cysteiniphilum halobium]|uniref:glutathione S-transferase family protein n=1 Tax=Cysteiniphilum halobium TaxID=2219059 RepID=UPI003F828A3A